MTSPTPPPVPPSIPPSYVARTPVDLLALVPLVLGFHPDDSVVLLTFGGPGRSFHARVDLPVSAADQEEVADRLADAVAANGQAQAALVVYSDDEQVCASMTSKVLERLCLLGCEVLGVMRVDDGRWFEVPEDGSPGTPYDLQTHPFTARHVFEGRVVHGDRAALADTLIGTDEDDAVAVAQSATRFADVLLDLRVERAVLRTEARWFRRRVRQRVRDGRPLDVTDAARMLVLAALKPTRDVAWAEVTRRGAPPHVELWRELVRRAPLHLLPGAASLLAFAAWQAGDGALAWCAIDRALEVDPDCTLAQLVAELLSAAVSPDVWEPLTDADLPVLAPDPGPADRAS